jgi:hypothetical protein
MAQRRDGGEGGVFGTPEGLAARGEPVGGFGEDGGDDGGLGEEGGGRCEEVVCWFCHVRFVSLARSWVSIVIWILPQSRQTWTVTGSPVFRVMNLMLSGRKRIFPND